jgi:DNA replication protein DnaC
MKTLSSGTIIGDADYALLRGREIAQMMIAIPFTGCANCGGAGRLFFHILDDAGASARTFVNGEWRKSSLKSFPCPICNTEGHQQSVKARLANSGLEQGEFGYSIDYIADMAGKQHAVKVARGIVSELPTPKGFYLLYGEYGVGKSGTLKSIVAAACHAGVGARYVTAEDILTEIRDTFSDKSDATEKVLVERYAHFPLLAIDELGVDRMSNTQWALSKLFAVIDKRYGRRDRLCTITASNNTPDQLRDNSSWAYFENRTRDGIRVPVGGDSLRGKK